MRTLAIIPARGGSKGVPGKNTRIVDGKPLIAYSIETALECDSINEVIVTSDSPDILDIAAKYTQITLHQRPADLANDTSPITDTIHHLLEGRANQFDLVMLLQPTAPLRYVSQIEEAISSIARSEFPSLISVCAMDDVHPARMYWKRADGSLEIIMPEFEKVRRQDIPPAYYRNGSIYIARVQDFLHTGQLIIAPSLAFLMPPDQLLNIDSERDMLIAEVLINQFYKKPI